MNYAKIQNCRPLRGTYIPSMGAQTALCDLAEFALTLKGVLGEAASKISSEYCSHNGPCGNHKYCSAEQVYAAIERLEELSQ